MPFATCLTKCLFCTSWSECHFSISICAWEMIGSKTSLTGRETKKTSTWFSTMVASCVFGTSRPNLEKVYKVATICDFMDISWPESAVYVNELVNLERNKSSSHSKFTFKLTHDTLKLLLWIIYLDVFLSTEDRVMIMMFNLRGILL